MNTEPTTRRFVYHIDADNIPFEDARPKVRQWANRRRYPISFEVLPDKVVVYLDAPDSKEHNRAVRSLSSILNRVLLCHML